MKIRKKLNLSLLNKYAFSSFTKNNGLFNKNIMNINNKNTNFNINNLIKTVYFNFSKQNQTKPTKTEPVKTNNVENASNIITNKDALFYSFNVNRPEFKLYENLNSEDQKLAEKKRNKEIDNYYGGTQYLNLWKKGADYEFLAKRKRRVYLNSGYQSEHPVVIPVKRIRNNKDDYVDLVRRKHEIVAVINPRDDFPEVQLVIDLKYVKRIEM